MRPLDFLGRIKVKLGIVIVLAVVTAFVVNEVGIDYGLSRDVRIAIAVVLALIMVQLLARGMTRPLREMAAATQTIAKGRYGMRVSATSRDEVGELARAFNAMAADLGEVDRQRRELVANVSHELRTPITGLQAVLENVVDGVSPPDLDTLGTALAQTQRLGRLVTQLLDLSRLDSGARLIEPEPIDLASLCRQATLEAGFCREEVTVMSEVRPGLTVRADPDLLAQVLANLLDNAVRHSPAEGTVRLEARLTGPGLEIAVTDAGPGIPPEDRTRIFERFSRLDPGRTADSGGAGLGLAITKEIVELHGGSIMAADPVAVGRRTPRGCRMVVTLPAASVVLGGAPIPDRVSEPAAAAAVSGPVSGLEPGPSAQVEETGMPDSGVPDTAAPDTGVLDTGALDTGVSDTGVSDTAAPDTAAPDTGPAEGAAPYPGGFEAGRFELQGGAIGAAERRRAAAVTARAALGAGIGMFVGFGIGLFIALFLQLFLGGAAGPITMLLLSCAGAVIGAATGSSSGVKQRTAPAFRSASGSTGDPSTGDPSMGRSVSESDSSTVRSASTVRSVSRYDTGGKSLDTTDTRGDHRLMQPVQPVRPVRSAHPDYVPPPLFPRPELPDAPRWLLPVVGGVGLTAAVAVPYAPLGLGLVLTAVALGGAALPIVLRRRRERLTPWTVAFGLLAYALVAVALFRDADWLVGPMLLAGFAVAALALSGGGANWLGVIKGGLSVVVALFPLPWFLSGPTRRLLRHRRMLPVVVSVIVTTVLLGVFGLLFMSADAVFSAFMSDLLRTPEWAENLPYRVFVFAVFAALAAAAVLVALRPVAEPDSPDLKINVGRTLWVIPLFGLNLLFASFVTVQVTVLFGGNRRVLSTAGLTYAEYARSGFFELVTVSVFVLGIVAAGALLLRLGGRGDRWALAVLLGLLCAFTLVILASAVHRLDLYIDAYGLSRLRALVGATIWWLAAVFVLVLVAGAVRLSRRGAGWFPRSLVLLTGAAMLLFAIWNPDAKVAESQLVVRGVDRLDHRYLGDLGAEAVPVLDRLPEPDRSCVLHQVVARNGLSHPDPWNGWNLAREQARDVLERRPLRPAVAPGGFACPDR